ncbi:MAG TPA: membrane protein insertion efficiency factor YidD [Terriglobales bacterium]|nr:membrane protein insertion efficiency factor YidD [Terriglobales bacterium]
MSTLRKCLKHPGTYLALSVLLMGLILLDGLRTPDREITGPAYICLVHAYQHGGRPLLEGRVKCRFQPTCSNYSIEAVERHGFTRGIGMTMARLWRCRSSVRLGTVDPVV